jgi:P-loop Domain of unknown function (DUF2791)
MVFASGDPSKFLVPDEALTAFMEHCDRKIGEAYFRTPRSTVKAFVHMLSVLEQNPGTKWEDLLDRIPIAPDAPDVSVDADGNGDGDELTSLRLNS